MQQFGVHTRDKCAANALVKRRYADEAPGSIINLFGWFQAASICVTCHLSSLVIVIGVEP